MSTERTGSIMDMTPDALREARSALQDAYQAVLDADYPEDQQAAIVLSLDNALIEVDDALRMAGVQEDE
jgi:hypothetical protein